MIGSQKSGLFRAGWRHRPAKLPVARCRQLPRHAGRAYFGAHIKIEAEAIMSVARLVMVIKTPENKKGKKLT